MSSDFSGSANALASGMYSPKGRSGKWPLSATIEHDNHWESATLPSISLTTSAARSQRRLPDCPYSLPRARFGQVGNSSSVRVVLWRLRCTIRSFGGTVHILRGLSRTFREVRAQELCGSRGGRPGLPSLINLMVSVDVKQH